MSNLVSLAESIAREAHRGQTRRGGHAYITHPEAVAQAVTGDDAKAVAWLHDVLEDTAETEETLHHAGIPHNVIHAVKLLTKSPGQSQYAYLRDIKESHLATTVKLADMRHNLASQPTATARRRYQDAIRYLEYVRPDYYDDEGPAVDD